MIIKWYSFFLGAFVRHLENKLSTCGSNLNFRLVSMSVIKKICLKEILTQNFNTLDLVNVFGKVSKTSHLDCSDYIEDDTIQNHEQNRKVKSEK
jgi:hypothetical protein